MSILVTGATGFVGLAIVEALLARGDHVVMAAITPPPVSALGTFAKLPGKADYELCDVSDETAVAALFEAYQPDKVIQGAAVTIAGGAEEGRASAAIQVNLQGTVNVLESALKSKVKRLIFLSSSSVYGAASYGGDSLHEETTPAAPESFYAVTKFAAERFALRFRQFGLNVAALRLGAVYGPWEYLSGMRDTPSALFQAVRLAIAGDEAVFSRRGPNDWIYSRDVAGAVLANLDRDDGPLLANVGYGDPSWAVADWCAEIAKAFPDFSWRQSADATPTIDFFGIVDRAPLNNRRLVDEIGYQPRFGLPEAAADYLDWLRDHRDLVLKD